jgi:hypothetical protein
MIRDLLHLIIGRSERQDRIHKQTLIEPLQRFAVAQRLGNLPHLSAVAAALAQQTKLMVESLVSNEAIPDWASAGRSATNEQFANLSIFCSHCIVQSTIHSVKLKCNSTRINERLLADLHGLIRVMYGDFGANSPLGAITFDELLELHNFDDELDLSNLTKLLDQCLQKAQPDDLYRAVKVRHLRALLTEHRRAFAYPIHKYV